MVTSDIGFHDSPHDGTTSQSESARSSSDSYEEHWGWVLDRAWLNADGGVPVDTSNDAKTPLSLGLVRFPKLEKLTVGNVLVDTDFSSPGAGPSHVFRTHKSLS